MSVVSQQTSGRAGNRAQVSWRPVFLLSPLCSNLFPELRVEPRCPGPWCARERFAHLGPIMEALCVPWHRACQGKPVYDLLR